MYKIEAGKVDSKIKRLKKIVKRLTFQQLRNKEKKGINISDLFTFHPLLLTHSFMQSVTSTTEVSRLRA
jgi:predicted transcriptional regulator